MRWHCRKIGLCVFAYLLSAGTLLYGFIPMKRRLSWQIPPKPILLVKASVLNCKKLHGLILPKNQLLRPLIASVEPEPYYAKPYMEASTGVLRRRKKALSKQKTY